MKIHNEKMNATLVDGYIDRIKGEPLQGQFWLAHRMTSDEIEAFLADIIRGDKMLDDLL